MEVKDAQINDILNQMPPIKLEDMESIRLMNRLDTKFVSTKDKLIKLLDMMRGEYYVQDIHSVRICPYQNTYFDTEDHIQFIQHHNKHANRTKVRVRTYLVDGDVTFLEVKNKNNHGRTNKKRMRIDSLNVVRQTEGTSELVEKRTGIDFSLMKSVIQNNFDRITLVNLKKTERLTIDFNIQFLNLETQNSADTDQLVIIELKRDRNTFSPVIRMLNQLRIHHTAFSKYCVGMCLTDSKLKQNRFKQQIRKLNKINASSTTKIE